VKIIKALPSYDINIPAPIIGVLDLGHSIDSSEASESPNRSTFGKTKKKKKKKKKKKRRSQRSPPEDEDEEEPPRSRSPPKER